MKKTNTIIALLLTMSTLSASAMGLERCFTPGAGRVARIIMNDKSRVFVDWNLSDHSLSTEESGDATHIKKTDSETSFDVYLDGTNDGSNFRFSVKENSVSVQGLTSNDEPTGEPTKCPVVSCPK